MGAPLLGWGLLGWGLLGSLGMTGVVAVLGTTGGGPDDGWVPPDGWVAGGWLPDGWVEGSAEAGGEALGGGTAEPDGSEPVAGAETAGLAGVEPDPAVVGGTLPSGAVPVGVLVAAGRLLPDLLEVREVASAADGVAAVAEGELDAMTGASVSARSPLG